MPGRRGNWGPFWPSRKIGLVFGGGRVGLMGQLAEAALESNGEVIGVIPRELHEKRVAFTGLSDLRVVESMHERKALMAELADGFMALPGGLGTLEEVFEILTWGQLGIHHKPCGLLNVAGYFTPLLAFLDRVVAAGLPGRAPPCHDPDRRRTAGPAPTVRNLPALQRRQGGMGAGVGEKIKTWAVHP